MAQISGEDWTIWASSGAEDFFFSKAEKKTEQQSTLQSQSYQTEKVIDEYKV